MHRDIKTANILRVVAITCPRNQRRKRTLRVFNRQGQTFRELYSRSLFDAQVVLSRHRYHLALAYPDGVVEHCEIQEATVSKWGEVQLSAPAVVINISPAGDRLLTVGPEHEVRVWNASDGRPFQRWEMLGRRHNAIFLGASDVGVDRQRGHDWVRSERGYRSLAASATKRTQKTHRRILIYPGGFC